MLSRDPGEVEVGRYDRTMVEPVPVEAQTTEPDGATEAKRDAILAAALAVFAAKGFKGATIKAIAGEAQLRSPALLYWYFPNKAAIFAAVLRRYAPVLSDVGAARDAIDQPSEQFLGEVMLRALERFADADTRKAFWLLIVEYELLAEHGFDIGQQQPDNIFTVLADHFRRQIELGRMREHDVDTSARIVIGQLNVALQVRTAPLGLLPPSPPDDELVANTLDVLLNGLRAGGPTEGRTR